MGITVCTGIEQLWTWAPPKLVGGPADGRAPNCSQTAWYIPLDQVLPKSLTSPSSTGALRSSDAGCYPWGTWRQGVPTNLRSLRRARSSKKESSGGQETRSFCCSKACSSTSISSICICSPMSNCGEQSQDSGWLPPIRSGCPGLHPTQPWAPPGMVHPHSAIKFHKRGRIWEQAPQRCPAFPSQSTISSKMMQRGGMITGRRSQVTAGTPNPTAEGWHMPNRAEPHSHHRIHVIQGCLSGCGLPRNNCFIYLVLFLHLLSCLLEGVFIFFIS